MGLLFQAAAAPKSFTPYAAPSRTKAPPGACSGPDSACLSKPELRIDEDDVKSGECPISKFVMRLSML